MSTRAMRNLWCLAIGLGCLFSPHFTSLTAAEPADWPQFLGPQRNGISGETGLINSWPTDGLPIVWRKPGGTGMSGLAISQGQLVTMVQRDRQQILLALDAKTGELKWETPIAPNYRNSMGDGPRATPAIAGDRVFVFTGEGILAAVDFKKGKVLWSRPVLKDLEGREADYGMACSPLVVGDQVIVSLGAPDAAVAAFDVATGKTAWQAGEGMAGYSSPALLKVGDSQQIVAFTGEAVWGLEPGSGKQLWSYPYETDFGCNIATPVSYQGQVFISAGENHGCVLLEIKKTGAGWKPIVAWESQGPKSVLRNEWQTSILLGDYLYGFDNVGGAGPVSHLTCVRADDGKVAWQKPRFGKGNLIAADGKLFLAMMTGELIVLRANPEKYEEIGRMQVLDSTRQAPALANGLLYLRDGQEIVCLDARQK